MSDTADLLKTPLHALHIELGARMVPLPAIRCRCNTRAA
jgi:hypothetical protein